MNSYNNAPDFGEDQSSQTSKEPFKFSRLGNLSSREKSEGSTTDSEEEDDGSSETSLAKKRRFRRSFRSFFMRHIARKDASAFSRTDSDSYVAREVEETVVSVPKVPAEESEPKIDTHEAIVPTSQPDSNTMPTSTTQNAPLSNADIAPPAPPVPPVKTHMEGEGPVPPIPILTHTHAVPRATELHETPASTTVVERSPNLIGPLVAFLAANFLSKRRDRKIKREVLKLDKKHKQAEEQTKVDQQRTATKEVNHERQHREIQQRITKLEQTPNSQQKPEERVTSIKSEKLPDLEQPKAPVRIGEVLPAVAPLMQERPPVFSREEIEEQPQLEVAQTTEVGYEQQKEYQQAERSARVQTERDRLVREQQATAVFPENETSEVQFDRRHEVRDAAAHYAATPGAHTPMSHAAAALAQPAMSRTSSSSSSSASSGSDPGADLYRQSLRAGFITGIIVVLLAFIATLSLN